jgi:hypothetical protein
MLALLPICLGGAAMSQEIIDYIWILCTLTGIGFIGGGWKSAPYLAVGVVCLTASFLLWRLVGIR